MKKDLVGGFVNLQRSLLFGGDYDDFELAKPEEGEDKPFQMDVFTKELPEYMPKDLRKLVHEWGDAKITKIRICRVPLNSLISRLGNIVTLGNLEKRRKELEKLDKDNYNNLYHLYMELALKKPDGKINVVRIEKNQKLKTIRIENAGVLPKEARCINQPVTKNITLGQLFENAEKAVGAKRLYTYDLSGTNCQMYVVDMLGSSGLLTAEGRKFTLQRVKDLVPSWLLKGTKLVTNLANRLQSWLYGRGLKGGVWTEKDI